MQKHLLSLFLLVSPVLCASQPEIVVPDNFVIESVKRTIDLTSQIVKVKTEYQVKNNGKAEVSYFVHAMSESEAKRLSWMSAVESDKEGAKLRITKVSVKGSPADFVFHKIELLNLIESEQTYSLSVEYSLTQYLVPYPKEISQTDNQLMLYNGYANVLSPFVIGTQMTTVVLSKTKPISFTEMSPSKYSNGQIEYGPYQNIHAYTKNAINIHYENNSPFLVATSVERIIEVSHWGNIAVEERIEIVHKGAYMKGSFSRLDFQLDRRGAAQPCIKSFKTNLPSDAYDIYYRDEIGNISTSNVYSRGNRVEVELRPRFPLFGGWRTNYVLGYNLPTTGYLFATGPNHALKFRLLSHLYNDAVVEKLRVKIIIPETSRNIKLIAPYATERLPDEIHKTYLDTVGRPVIVLEKQNLVNSHIQTFTLYYDFDRINLLREPFLLVAAFGIIFLVAIILFRLDFSIQQNGAKGELADEKDTVSKKHQ